MPTYLIHGFRWPRPLIRIHIILQNLDDAAAEWICSPTTTMALLQNFVELFPHAMPFLPQLRFIEQYDPSDLSAASLSQPHAYVADIVEEVKLGVDVDEVRGKGVGNEQWGALMEIRDKIAPDEKVGWWVVVCGDEERWAPPTNELSRGGFHTPAVGHTHEDRGRDGRNGVASSSANETQLKELRQSLGYHTESEDNATSSGAATVWPSASISYWSSILTTFTA